MTSPAPVWLISFEANPVILGLVEMEIMGISILISNINTYMDILEKAEIIAWIRHIAIF